LRPAERSSGIHSSRPGTVRAHLAIQHQAQAERHVELRRQADRLTARPAASPCDAKTPLPCYLGATGLRAVIGRPPKTRNILLRPSSRARLASATMPFKRTTLVGFKASPSVFDDTQDSGLPRRVNRPTTVQKAPPCSARRLGWGVWPPWRAMTRRLTLALAGQVRCGNLICAFRGGDLSMAASAHTSATCGGEEKTASRSAWTDVMRARFGRSYRPKRIPPDHHTRREHCGQAARGLRLALH